MRIEILILIFAFYIRYLLSKPGRNVILGMPYTTECRSQDRVSFITDGIIRPDSIEIFRGCQARKIHVEIEFIESIMVEEVLLWLAHCDGCFENAFDYYMVFLKTLDPTKYMTLHYCGRSLAPNDPMRVIVYSGLDLRIKTTSVETNPSLDISGKMFGLSEVQMTELSFTSKTFYGCFGSYHHGNVKSLNTYEKCKRHCFKSNHWFFVLKNSKCICSSIAPKYKLKPSACGEPCSGDPEEFCPHINTKHYPIFIAKLPAPKFYGCYVEDADLKFELKMESDDLTPIKCILYCSKHRKLNAFLHNSRECSCSDEIVPTKQVCGTKCDMPCSGLPLGPKICGGQETYSVFSECVHMKNQSPCFKIVQCEHGNIDEFGVCQGSCNPGWTGERCLDYVVKFSLGSNDALKEDNDVYDNLMEHYDVNSSVSELLERSYLPETKVIILLSLFVVVSVAVYYVILMELDRF